MHCVCKRSDFKWLTLTRGSVFISGIDLPTSLSMSNYKQLSLKKDENKAIQQELWS